MTFLSDVEGFHIDADETMSIHGGIDLYANLGKEDDEGTKRYGDAEEPTGRRVVYLDCNGIDSDREHARKFFKKHQVLTVTGIEVDSWTSRVEFEEYPGEKFNTVMFTDLIENDVCYKCGKYNDDTDECCDCPDWNIIGKEKNNE